MSKKETSAAVEAAGSKTAQAAPAAAAEPKEKKGFSKAAFIVAAAITVIGIGFWIYQIITGPRTTAITNDVSWGIDICLFTLFVGLSAGGLIVASSAHVFNIESFKKVALPAVITSTVCICLAVGFILVDLGHIENFIWLFAGANFVSPLLWDVVVILSYFVINVLDIVFIWRGDERKVKVLSWIALPVAILVHSVTAWIFALQLGHSWYTAIMAPIFVVSALDSGLALLLVELVILERRGLFHTGDDLFKSLARLLCVFVAIDAFLIACELLTMGYPGAGEATVLGVIATGALAPYFWFEVIAGILVPFIALVSAKRREKRWVVVASSVLVVLGVLCKRIWILFSGFIAPYAEGAPVVAGSSPIASLSGEFGALGAIYMPTPIDFIIAIAVLALGVFLFMLLCQKLLTSGPKANVAADVAASGKAPIQEAPLPE